MGLHMTGGISSCVFQAALQVIGSYLLRHIFLLLGPQLDCLLGHPSLTKVIDLAAQVDHHVLVVQLVSTGNVKVCGLLLHSMSGKLDTIVITEKGRDLLCAFIRAASDLQVELVMDELCQDKGHLPPLVMQLVLTRGEDSDLRE